MQRRGIAIIIITVGLFHAGLVNALGLGEISLKSQFNEPLVADIQLLKARDLSEEEIIVSLASRQDFQRAGLDRLFFLTSMRYSVVLDNPSNPYIRITTTKPVIEPYLNFLLDVRWPSGRILREYTLLLDLPVFAKDSSVATAVSPSNTVEAKAAAQATTARSLPSDPPVSPSIPVSRDATAETASTYDSAVIDRYEVRSGDTLSEIARNVLPGGSPSINQTMIAIQRANPDAFINNNINLLRRGQVLRIPDQSEIAQISTGEAIASVRQQTQAWKQRQVQKQTLISVDPAIVSNTNNSTQPEGRLVLGSAARSGQQGSGLSSNGGALRSEMNLLQEELDRSRRENTELRDRAAELQSQIDTMERLAEVTNNQLKALELATQSATDEKVENLPLENEESAIPESESGIFLGDSSAADSTTSETIEAEDSQETVAVAEPSRPLVTAAEESQPTANSYVELIERNKYVIGGGLIALFLVVLILLRNSSKNKKEDEFNHFDFDQDDDDFDTSGDDELLPAEELVDFDDVEPEPVEAQTEDVVAEADIYSSLGQQDKAIELLEKEIQQNPDNTDARLSLLRIYSSTQNAEAFDEQYAQLLPLDDQNVIQQAKKLRSAIEGIEDFDTDSYSYSPVDNSDELYSSNEGSSSTGKDLEALNLDLDAEDNNPVAQSAKSTDSDLQDLDFDLDLDQLEDDLKLDGDSELSFDTDFDDQDSSLSYSDDAALEWNDDRPQPETGDLDLDSEPKSTSNQNLSLNDGHDDISDLETKEIETLGTLEYPLGPDGESITDSSELDLQAPNTDLANTEGSLDNITRLDLNIDDDFAKSPIDLEEGAIELATDVDDSSFEYHESLLDSSSEKDLKTAENLGADFDLDDDKEDFAPHLENRSKGEIGDLDLDFPPRGDINISDLDKEIGAMTGDINDNFDVDDTDSQSTISGNENTEIFKDDLNIDEIEQTLSLQPPVLDNSLTSDELSTAEEDEFDFPQVSDETATKLDLAKAYLDMGDHEGAKDILVEVLDEGNQQQKDEAQELMRDL